MQVRESSVLLLAAAILREALVKLPKFKRSSVRNPGDLYWRPAEAKRRTSFEFGKLRQGLSKYSSR